MVNSYDSVCNDISCTFVLATFHKSFYSQIPSTADKGCEMILDLGRFVANVNGSSSSKRTLLMTTVQSGTLNEVKVWEDAVEQELQQNVLVQAQGKDVLGITSAYSTV